MQTNELQEVIRSVLNDRLPNAHITRVAIKSDVDSEGDNILRVVVVLEDAPSHLDKKALVGLVRHLRSRLEEVNREEFPVLSFVSRGEAKRLDLEAA